MLKIYLNVNINWPVICWYGAMIARFFLILASLIVIGVIGTFLLFVSALSLLTAIAVGIGLLATLALGYWAGSNSVKPALQPKRMQKNSVINAPPEIIYFPELPARNEQTQQDALAEELYEVTPIR